MELEKTKRFLDIVHDLRTQCPWDRKQTHQSLKPYLVEEAYEVLDALDTAGQPYLKDELGDLLLQIALHAEIGSESGSFDFEAIAEAISKKMIHRHPHIYAEVKVKDADQVKENWEKLKGKEKPDQHPLAGIAKALPALQLAYKYGQTAGSMGFDWPSAKEVLDKAKEELGELEAELAKEEQQQEAIEMELGDLLFALSNLARHLKLDAEMALRKSAKKFADRFELTEKEFARQGKKMSDCTIDELEEVWQAVKRRM